MAPIIDTITAVATPPGRGAIGIVRISGPLTKKLCHEVIGKILIPRKAQYCSFYDAKQVIIDAGLALFFPQPNSFTGEDLLELQGHGGPIVMDMLLQRILSLGARLAQPGEFSKRAFLNDKIDLVKAEAIADLIDSATEQAARLSIRSLQGTFSKRINSIVKMMIDLRTELEATIDFSEDEIHALSANDVANQLQDIIDLLQETLRQARQSCLIREGITIVIAGAPNVGKSTLMNLLAGQAKSIVTNIPGTTRDLLKEWIQIDGLPVHLVDTAGLRASNEPIEVEGVKRARKEIDNADLVLYLIDDKQGLTAQDKQFLSRLHTKQKCVLIRNKIDLSGTSPGIIQGDELTAISMSAMQGKGIDLLRGHIKKEMGSHSVEEGVFMARRRHIDSLKKGCEKMLYGLNQWHARGAIELLAEDLRLGQRELSKITGEFSTEDLLGHIFSRFCIGK